MFTKQNTSTFTECAHGTLKTDNIQTKTKHFRCKINENKTNTYNVNPLALCHVPKPTHPEVLLRMPVLLFPHVPVSLCK